MIIDNEQVIEIFRGTGWVLKGRSLVQSFKFETFMEAISFINNVADFADGLNHYPDIEIHFNRVKLVLLTRDEGGITEKDIDLADKIDGLV